MYSKPLLIILIIFATSGIKAKYNYEVSDNNCAGLDNRIKNLNKKMRAGYSASQGEIWKEQYRKLNKQKYSCRKKRFSTK